MQVALYGDIPSSRWGHQMVAETDEGKNKVLLFGGINLNSYCDSTIYEFNFSEKVVHNFIEE
jgi:hypothetical protein